MMEQVGAHWSSDVQVDVVATNWREKHLLLGEAKWQTEPAGCRMLRELVDEKTPRVLAALPDDGEGWRVHHVFFARAGFTDAAQVFSREHTCRLIDLTN